MANSFTVNQNTIRRLKNHIKGGMVMMASDIANYAGDYAPYKTGALSNSIRIADNGNTVLVLAGGQSPSGGVIKYARIHEYGGWTGRGYKTYIKPKHYMQNGYETVISGDWRTKYFGGFKG